MAETSKPNTRRRKLRAMAAFCLTGGLVLTSKMIMRMRDESSKERLITKERRPLTVVRKINSGTGLISTVGSDGSDGSDGSLGMLNGSLGIIMIDHAGGGNSHWDCQLNGGHQACW
jgi:hypothetical protein